MSIMIFKLSIMIILTSICAVSSIEIITRYDEKCNVSEKLKLEILSYKNITKKIISDIKNIHGKSMYEEYSRFIDNFGARPSGSQVLEDSIDYMVNLTKSMGIYDITTENVEGPQWVRGEEKLYMYKPYSKSMELLGLGYSVSTPMKGITAEVIVLKSFEELDNTAEKKIKGKIVVFDEPFISYAETVLYRVHGASKASAKGALAALIRSVTPFSLYTPHTGSMGYFSNTTKIPTAAITHEDADLMRRLQNNGKTIVVRLIMQNKLNDLKRSRNTLIDLKGKINPEKQVIVSGHIDSWDVGQGASDDGGGMWISWFIPVILKKIELQPRRTVRAILWTMEEMGLIGAISYLNRHKEHLNNINFIMESDEGTFRPLGLEVGGSDKARCILAEILKLFPDTNTMKKSDNPGSDIVVFINKGIPGASLLNQNERYFWYHHTNADTLIMQKAEDVIDCAAFWAAVSYVIADLSEDIPRN